MANHDSSRSSNSGSRSSRGARRWEPPDPAALQAAVPKYEILALLGRGGMGAVYKGMQRAIGRPVAIKVLPPGIEVGDGAGSYAERFKNEARAMGALSHPGIVRVFDFGETAEGVLYFVMEFVEGRDVSQLLKERGPLPPEQALAIGRSVCDALSYAHAAGIVHRDIKPANIMLGGDGRVRVADFGLARAESRDLGLTLSSYVVGTPDFLAPESFGDLPVDGRADVYSLGVTLYAMLTGKVPRGIPELPTRLVPGLDPGWDRVVEQALKHDPAERYQSAAEMGAALAALAQAPGGAASATSAYGASRTPSSGVSRHAASGGSSARGAKAKGRSSAVSRRPGSTASRSKAVRRPSSGASGAGTKPGRRGHYVVAAFAAASLLGGAGYWLAASRDQGADPSIEQGVGIAALPVGSEPEAIAPQPPPPEPPAPSAPEPEAAAPSEPLRAFLPEPVVVRQESLEPLLQATREAPFVNSLGMAFVPLPGQEALLCIHETRWRDYAEFAAVNPGIDDTWRNQTLYDEPITDRAGDHPVINVTWHEAKAFCDWLGRKEGLRYRLPTDREWSVAVGLGEAEYWTETKMPENVIHNASEFPWGRAWPPPPGTGNFRDESSDALWSRISTAPSPMPGYNDGFPSTAPVMSFPPNNMGLFDLAGNAREWTDDWWDRDATARVQRGSSWGNIRRSLYLSGQRFRIEPSRRDAFAGFRLAIELSEKVGNEPWSDAVYLAPPSPLPEYERSDASFAASVEAPEAAGKDAPFVNSLGMAMVPVEGTRVLFCVHETRWKDYAAFAEENPGISDRWRHQTHDGLELSERSEEHPVTFVSRNEAVAFCEWLSRKEGRAYRLPTDREWSIAVGLGEVEDESEPLLPSERGPSHHFPWGAYWPPPLGAGNYSDISRSAEAPREGASYLHGYDDGHPTTAPVMSYAPNAFGIHDLGGNVAELTLDWFDRERENPSIRGGSWSDGLEASLRSSKREPLSSSFSRRISVGFRIVLDLDGDAAGGASPSRWLDPGGSFTDQPAAAGTDPLLLASKESPFENSLGMKFVPVPGTRVLFCIHETRRRDYERYVEENPTDETPWRSRSHSGYRLAGDLDDHPVGFQSWDDAKAFCEWLSRKEGRIYRLPTDREWSIAVGIDAHEERATDSFPRSAARSSGRYPWGPQWPPPPSAGNFSDLSRKEHAWREEAVFIEGYDDGFPLSAPVMSFPPNEFGLYDLSGNVWEWCEDWRHWDRTRKVLRGGSWQVGESRSLELAHRHFHARETQFSHTGFRVVVVVPPRTAAAEMTLSQSPEGWVSLFDEMPELIETFGLGQPDDAGWRRVTKNAFIPLKQARSGTLRLVARFNPADSGPVLFTGWSATDPHGRHGFRASLGRGDFFRSRLYGGYLIEVREHPSGIRPHAFRPTEFGLNWLNVEDGDEYVLELSIADETLTILVNGKRIREVRMEAFPGDWFAMETRARTELKSLDWRPLPRSARSASTAPLPSDNPQAPESPGLVTSGTPGAVEPSESLAKDARSMPPSQGASETDQAVASSESPPADSDPAAAAVEAPRDPAEGLAPGEAREFSGIAMVWCPPGEFIMGSTDRGGSRSARPPNFSVSLTRGFWLAKTECTQAQWLEVMDRNPSRFKGETLPVERVSWEDAQEWIERMNQRRPGPEGWMWSLPTEAQWEYAARALTSERSTADNSNSWNSSTADGGGRQTNPVATKRPNAIGLHDMLGNVMEWCLDRHSDYPSGPVSDPVGPAFGTNRVNRGGNWKMDIRQLDAGTRFHRPPNFRSDDLGFRAALVRVD